MKLIPFKTVPHFRQDFTANVDNSTSRDGQTFDDSSLNSTVVESRGNVCSLIENHGFKKIICCHVITATMTGIRAAPSYGSQVIPGYLAQEVTSHLNLRNSTLNATNVDDRNKYNVNSGGVTHASLNLNSYSDPYGGHVYNLSPDYGYPAYAYPPPPAVYQPPPPSAAYPRPPPPAVYPPPPPPAAYSSSAYAVPAPAAYPAPAYLPPPPPSNAAAPALSYTKVLSKVLGYYPAQSSAYLANYSTQYDYTMPVAVVNVFCSDSKYPCSCTIYLTEINSYNMLISGVCSGKCIHID